MNPQADPNTTPGQPDAALTPQPRPETQLNVPTRPIHDYDESAFSVENTPPPPSRAIPAPPPRPVVLSAPQRPPQPQPITAPAPQPTVSQVTPSTAPQLAPAAAIQPAAPVSTPAPAQTPQTPLPPVVTMPTPTAPPVVANPAPTAQPPARPAQSTAVTLQPSVPAAIPPMPVAAVEPQAATAATAPTPTVTFEPATPPNPTPGPHTDQAIIERIDETPQQNSRDIEELIEKNHRLRRLKGVASFIAFAVSVVIAAFLINQFVFQSYYVDGTSMVPTLHNDDRLIIDKTARTFAGVQGKPYIPERGQIVVLDSSIVGFNGREEQLIKRVVGVPGDTVIIQDGTVTVKNKENPDGFDFNQKFGLNLQPTYVESPQEWRIDDNHLFVMGDNRTQNGSYDSRAFGPVESNKIVGRLWVRILPFDKAQVY